MSKPGLYLATIGDIAMSLFLQCECGVTSTHHLDKTQVARAAVICWRMDNKNEAVGCARVWSTQDGCMAIDEVTTPWRKPKAKKRRRKT